MAGHELECVHGQPATRAHCSIVALMLISATRLASIPLTCPLGLLQRVSASNCRFGFVLASFNLPLPIQGRVWRCLLCRRSQKRVDLIAAVCEQRLKAYGRSITVVARNSLHEWHYPIIPYRDIPTLGTVHVLLVHVLPSGTRYSRSAVALVLLLIARHYYSLPSEISEHTYRYNYVL